MEDIAPSEGSGSTVIRAKAGIHAAVLVGARDGDRCGLYDHGLG
jgi:hypothetical protein